MTRRSHCPQRFRCARSALLLAIALALTAGQAGAQSNTTGAVFGQASPGATITLENPATGLRRDVTAATDGRFHFGALPPGRYTVTSGGATREVKVVVGSGSEVRFATAEAQQLTSIEVQANAALPIDVSSVESTTILTAEQLDRLPIARSTTGIALLAPGTTRGDPAFGGLASFGGSSVAENTYYVNGFNVTDVYRNLDFAEVPFEAIEETQGQAHTVPSSAVRPAAW